jgi:hypothetical protein
MSVMLLGQEDHEFKASLGYITRLCLSKKKKKHKTKQIKTQAPVAHACNSSFTWEGEENHNLWPAWVNCSQDPICKKTTKTKWGVAQA